MTTSDNKKESIASMWANIIEKSTGVKTSYALSAVAISFLFFFITFILTKIGSVSLNAIEFLVLTAMVLVALILILLIGKKRSPTPGQFVSEKEKAELPATSYDITRQITNLQNLTIILALADVSDYGATVNRLRNPINKNSDIMSVTALGIYGEHDFLFEVICEADKREDILKFIKRNLEVKEEVTKILKPLNIKAVAKLNGYEIGGYLNESLRSLHLKNGRFSNNSHDVSYKIIDLSKLTESGDLLAVPYMPIIISYVWLEPKNNSTVRKNAEDALEFIYDDLLKKNMNEIYSLYRLDTAVLIKSVFSVEKFYSFTRFTKQMDESLRLKGYSDILQVRTAVGAEIITWR